nr:ORF103A [Acipenserid herpesvirus 1]WJJ61091.1 ORF103A [Acipenserid herpesvirus 1]
MALVWCWWWCWCLGLVKITHGMPESTLYVLEGENVMINLTENNEIIKAGNLYYKKNNKMYELGHFQNKVFYKEEDDDNKFINNIKNKIKFTNNNNNNNTFNINVTKEDTGYFIIKNLDDNNSQQIHMLVYSKYINLNFFVNQTDQVCTITCIDENSELTNISWIKQNVTNVVNFTKQPKTPLVCFGYTPFNNATLNIITFNKCDFDRIKQATWRKYYLIISIVVVIIVMLIILYMLICVVKIKKKIPYRRFVENKRLMVF